MKKNDLVDKNAIERIQSILINTPTCMLISSLSKPNPSICPMTVKTIDNDGALWFLSDKESEHYKNIEKDNDLLLTFTNNTDKQYLSIRGKGIHYESKGIIDKLLSQQDLKNNNVHTIIILKVIINSAYYWDVNLKKSVTI
ncbi:pyridoxamine 5'-phosphate oxidase family protein [Tenacibaculum mesophilum]|uniref:pyridoxamine 5'-phosphate oxidase family protein n=1 Tax=Tenacibaculum mesophilum TaxID=104268 RepID=UPI00064B3CC3|nr:pyridoxamine 5'-phosphate oxidase family protein [Tenacibaculum mesophilum]